MRKVKKEKEKEKKKKKKRKRKENWTVELKLVLFWAFDFASIEYIKSLRWIPRLNFLLFLPEKKKKRGRKKRKKLWKY